MPNGDNMRALQVSFSFLATALIVLQACASSGHWAWGCRIAIAVGIVACIWASALIGMKRGRRNKREFR